MRLCVASAFGPLVNGPPMGSDCGMDSPRTGWTAADPATDTDTDAVVDTPITDTETGVTPPAYVLGASPARLTAALRSWAPPPDVLFDRCLPEALRAVSAQYWTPLAVAVRVARWVSEFELRTVLDIGSGVGKLCVASAVASTAEYIGLEQRPRLVSAARDLARIFQVEDRVRFIEGSLGEVETPVADAYYLYNPFGENLYNLEGCLDAEVELSRARFERDCATVEALLQAAPVGTCVITYNGFGGHTPATYREVRIDRTSTAILRLLRKSRRR